MKDAKEEYRQEFINEMASMVYLNNLDTSTIRVDLGNLVESLPYFRNYLLPKTEINEIIHFVVDLLDEALRKAKFVLIVLWKDVHFNRFNFLDLKEITTFQIRIRKCIC